MQKLWKLKIVVQIRRWDKNDVLSFKSDTSIDEKEGYRNNTPKPYIEDNYLNLMLHEVDWMDRMQKTRNEINQYLYSKSEDIFNVLRDWFIYEDHEYQDEVRIKSMDLNLSVAHAPAIALTIMYGPTQHNNNTLTKIINEAFEHWEDAGDEAFTIVCMQWKEQLLNTQHTVQLLK